MVDVSKRVWRVESPRWFVVVPRELLTTYHRVVGSEAVLLWLHLQCWQDEGPVEDINALVNRLQAQTGFAPETISQALQRLEDYELVSMRERVIRVRLPLSEEQFAIRFAAKLASRSENSSDFLSSDSLGDEDKSASSPSEETQAQWEEEIDLNTVAGDAKKSASFGEDWELDDFVDKEAFTSEQADLKAVLDIYHKRIGLMGPKQYDKLRAWVENKGMSADAVAAAIDRTAKLAKNPRIEYLEGILRNWYNEGIRTYEDVLKKYGNLHDERRGVDTSAGTSYEGMPNAGAYTDADKDLVRKWKELYPDEYDS